MSIPPVNLAGRAFKSDPYPFYARLRESAPVYCLPLPNGKPAWLVARYDDCLAVLKDTNRFVKNRLTVPGPSRPASPVWVPRILRPLPRNMLDLDAPDHARLRKLVQKAFTPRLVEGLRPRIQVVIDRLLDQAARRGEMDLIRDFALPLPVTIISEMIGVPEEDRSRFHQWSRRIVAADSSRWHTLRSFPNAIAFLRYIRRLIRKRREAPRDDLTSALVTAEEAGDKLSEDETVAMMFLLLVAGHETTVNLIGNGTLALLEHSEQLARLRRDPSLMKSAVEELLRFDGPLVMSTERYAREEVTIAGITIPQGALVYAVLASANRDGRQFENPDALLLSRHPKYPLAFWQGSLFCLGAALARMEGQMAIGALVGRFPSLALAVLRKSLRWRRGLVLRGVEAMPVKLG
jgi:cytochrome P450 PksS